MEALSSWFRIHKNVRRLILTCYLNFFDVAVFKLAFHLPPNRNISYAYWAVRNGNLRLLMWFHQKQYGYDQEYLKVCAAAYGHINILTFFGRPFEDRVATIAIKYGQLDVLKWLKDRMCISALKAEADAKRYGQKHILEWMQSLEKQISWKL